MKYNKDLFFYISKVIIIFVFWHRVYKNTGKEVYPFVGGYQDTPRGRIFYEVRTKLFVIKVGSWINDFPNAKSLIIDEFNLNGQNCRFEIDKHWEIGYGWEGW